jgi:hypothetical protein
MFAYPPRSRDQRCRPQASRTTGGIMPFAPWALGILLLSFASRAPAQPPPDPPLVPFIPASDVVAWQVPGGPTFSYSFGEGPNDVESATDLIAGFGLGPVAVPGGTRDSVVFLTESPADPDFLNDPNLPGVSDILAVKVVGGNAILSFWSDSANAGAPTASAFLTSLGLNNPIMTPLPETGAVQDLNALLFPAGSPFTKLVAGSDVSNLPIRDNGGGGGGGGGGLVFGNSDFVLFQEQAGGQPLGKPMLGVSFNDPPTPNEAIYPFLDKVYTITLPAGVPTIRDKIIRFTETVRGDDSPPNANLSDLQIMKVDSLGNQQFRLRFGFWSEDPGDPMGAAFLARAGLNNPLEIPEDESSHPPVLDLLFPEIPNAAQRPFAVFQNNSDPPVPEPPALTIAGMAFLTLLGYSWHRRERRPGSPRRDEA